MASIRRRGAKWQAQVRKQGHAPVTKTFNDRRTAEVWARQAENAIDLGLPPLAPSSDARLADILGRYLQEVTPRKKGKDQEARRLMRLLRDTIANKPLAELDGAALAAFRDRRIKDGMRACQYDLVLIRHAVEIARKEWGYRLVANPVDEIRIPNGIRARNRRLDGEEFAALRSASQQSRNRYIWPIVCFALETGMRRSEILRLRWSDIDWHLGLAHLDDSKNGEPRAVPLTSGAVELLRKLPRCTQRIFPVSEDAVRQSWERLVKRAGVADLHFHDLRHEAVSRFFERGLSVPEVALISGHKDVRMLFRYTHLKAADVSRKLGSCASVPALAQSEARGGAANA